jgi:thiamine-phosphate pyrophosphorylase
MLATIVKGLYAIVDLDFLSQHRLDPLDFVDAVLRARPGALQLRAKSAGARDTLALLRAMQARATPLGVPLFANDRPDLALLAGCGVHLGQDDLSAAEARTLGPALAIGVSTHGLEQLEQALRERPAYVALGPIFQTSSKHDPDPVVGLDVLAEAARRCRKAGIPLVAIGGLSLERAAAVAASAELGASISALLPTEGLSGVSSTARALHAALGGS